jgi:hypothetical protein
MCIDSRLPLKRKMGEYYNLNDCNYNPFIAKWAGELNFLSLNECGIISDQFEFKIDTEKINAINFNLYSNE